MSILATAPALDAGRRPVTRPRPGSRRRRLVPAVLLAGAALGVALLSTGPVPPPIAPVAKPAPPAPVALPGPELVELRTASSRTYAGPLGLPVTRIYQGPVNYRDAAGAWQPIDTTLAASAGGWAPRAVPVRTQLPASLAAPVRVSHGGHTVGFALHGAAGTAVVSGGTVTYRDALAGVDARYTARPDGVKEELILRGADAPTRFAFALDAAGLLPRAAPGGAVDLLGPTGRPVARLGAPFMSDAAGARSSAVALRVRRTGGSYVVVLSADRQWVRSPERQGAVTIDPTVTYVDHEFKLPTSDCYIASATPSTSYCGSDRLNVGVNGANRERGLLAFTLPSTLKRNVDVLDAEVNLQIMSRSTTAATTLDLERVTRTWSDPVTWSRATSTAAWTTAGGDLADAPAASRTDPGTGAELSFHPTAVVQDWADGKTANNGFLLRQRGEATAQEIRFYSLNYNSNPLKAAFLDVTYDPGRGALGKYQFHTEQLASRLSLNVNLANGNLLLRQRDLSIAGTGQKLNIDRYYNNFDGMAAANALLRGWTFGTGEDVALQEFENGDIAYKGASGYARRYERKSDGTYDRPKELNARLCKVDGADCKGDGTWLLRWNRSERKEHFDGRGRLIAVEDKNGHKLRYAYDDATNALTSITDTQGRVTRFGRAAGGTSTETITDPIGRVHRYAYKSSRIDTYTDPSGGVWSYSYDNQTFDLLSLTDPMGRVTTFTYDTRHRILSITRGVYVTRFAYEQAGTKCDDTKNTVVTDARGNKTTFCWDDQSRVNKTYDAAGHKRSSDYDAFSNVIATTGVAGGTAATPYGSTFEFDGGSGSGNGNLTAIEQPGETADSGAKWSGSYDGNRLSSATDSQGNKSNFNYDGSGNLRDLSVVTTTNGTESLARLDYYKADANDTAQCTSVPAAYDGPKGMLKCVRDGNGHETSYDYDDPGNLVTIDPPGPLGETRFTYDAISRMTSMTDGKGQKRAFTYDALDRVTKVTYYDAAATLVATVQFGYDRDGNLTSRTDAGGITSYAYDTRNNRITETFPGGQVNRYAYDGAGNLGSATGPGGTTLYAYNNLNLLSELTDPDGGKTTYGYNDDNSRTRTALPNGDVETRTHDKSERVKNITVKKADGTVVVDLTYDRLHAGRESSLIQKVVDGVRNTTTTYGYDHLARVTAAVTSGAASASYSYSYDANSNRMFGSDENGTSTTYGYDAANELTTANGTTFSYDRNGNLVSSSSGWRLEYNALNQTTAITPPGGTREVLAFRGAGQLEMTARAGVPYAYTLLGVGQKGAEAYVREPSGQLHSQRTGSGRGYYVLDAAAGSVVGLLDASGAMAVRYRYDPYGADEGQTGSLANSLRFAGGDYIGTLKLYKFGERFYDPELGRWTQQDPLEQTHDPKQANRFIYVGADPVNAQDPLGLFTISLEGDIGIPGTSASVGLGFEIGDGGASVSVGGGGGAGGSIALYANPWGTAGDGGGITGGGCASPELIGPAACYKASEEGGSVGVGAGTQASIQYEREYSLWEW